MKVAQKIRNYAQYVRPPITQNRTLSVAASSLYICCWWWWWWLLMRCCSCRPSATGWLCWGDIASPRVGGALDWDDWCLLASKHKKLSLGNKNLKQRTIDQTGPASCFKHSASDLLTVCMLYTKPAACLYQLVGL